MPGQERHHRVEPLDRVTDPGADRLAGPLGGIVRACTGTTAESGDPSELEEEFVAFGRQVLALDDVSVTIGLLDLGPDLVQAMPVGPEGLEVDHPVGAAWHRRSACELERRHLLTAMDEELGDVFLIGGTLLGLHEHPATNRHDSFTELRAGLDHLAFGCRERGELTTWQRHLDDLGIAHGGIVDAHYGSGLSFRDPDAIALVFFAPPA